MSKSEVVTVVETLHLLIKMKKWFVCYFITDFYNLFFISGGRFEMDRREYS